MRKSIPTIETIKTLNCEIENQWEDDFRGIQISNLKENMEVNDLKNDFRTKRDSWWWEDGDMPAILNEGKKLNLITLRDLQQKKKSGQDLTPWPLNRFVRYSLGVDDLTQLENSRVQQLMDDGCSVEDLYHLPASQS